MKELLEKIIRLKKEKNAIVLAHTYQPAEVQDAADFVGDSYGLSVKATDVADSDIIVFCGVQFMAETAKILSPNKKVIMPDADAGCPMADMITPDELIKFKAKYPDYVVMCYVNSTARIKALSDICCTSSNALKIAQQIPDDKGILFVPDKHLGSWVQEKTGHKMVLWDGFCPTHVLITPDMIAKAKITHPEAKVLIHPEAAKACRDIANAVLSTGGMCDFVKEDNSMEYIIATEIGIVHTLKTRTPKKTYFPISNKVTCPNMKKGSLKSLYKALEGTGGSEVVVSKDVATKAIGSIKRMLEMS